MGGAQRSQGLAFACEEVPIGGRPVLSHLLGPDYGKVLPLRVTLLRQGQGCVKQELHVLPEGCGAVVPRACLQHHHHTVQPRGLQKILSVGAQNPQVVLLQLAVLFEKKLHSRADPPYGVVNGSSNAELIVDLNDVLYALSLQFAQHGTQECLRTGTEIN